MEDASSIVESAGSEREVLGGCAPVEALRLGALTGRINDRKRCRFAIPGNHRAAEDRQLWIDGVFRSIDAA